jgi:hypothetical protein
MNLTICKCQQEKSNVMSLTTQTNIILTNPFFLFFWGKKLPNNSIVSNFWQKFPFLSKRIAQTPPILGSLG